MGKRTLDVLCALAILLLCLYGWVLMGLQSIPMSLFGDVEKAMGWLDRQRTTKL